MGVSFLLAVDVGVIFVGGDFSPWTWTFWTYFSCSKLINPLCNSYNRSVWHLHEDSKKGKVWLWP